MIFGGGAKGRLLFGSSSSACVSGAFFTSPTSSFLHHTFPTSKSVLLRSTATLAAATIMYVESCSSPTTTATTATNAASRFALRIPESTWRNQALDYQTEIHTLLKPGMMMEGEDASAPSLSALRQQRHRHRNGGTPKAAATRSTLPTPKLEWTALDLKHPVYNFLIEYYGIKGAKGVKRLARWAPSFALDVNHHDDDNENDRWGGILLQGATMEDYSDDGALLHLKGSTLIPNEGILFHHPSVTYNNQDIMNGLSSSSVSGEIHQENTFQNPNEIRNKKDSDNNNVPTDTDAARIRAVAPFLWYRAVLEQTLSAEPILHCHGLHEWAMQYHPPNAAPPPSNQYQSHLQLRVSQATLNDVVERRQGIHCTHVDALRYFAPAAASFNRAGPKLHRLDQLRMEQPACVHAHMDLLKMALKLQPYCSSTTSIAAAGDGSGSSTSETEPHGSSCFLLPRILRVALDARRLDVAASPYDASQYDGVPDAIPIETEEGRCEYQRQQMRLMKQAAPVRRDLLSAYNAFLHSAFDARLLQAAESTTTAVAPERFALTEPGGLPWRRNLVGANASRTAEMA